MKRKMQDEGVGNPTHRVDNPEQRNYRRNRYYKMGNTGKGLKTLEALFTWYIIVYQLWLNEQRSFKSFLQVVI